MITLKEKIIDFWTKHELKIVLTIGLILVSVISFESGFLKGKSALNSPVIIEKPTLGQSLSPESTQGSSLEAQKSSQMNGITISSSNVSNKNCAFVGSKKSNKYHLPTSRCAKQIKPENLICFSSVDDAIAKNYQEGCLK